MASTDSIPIPKKNTALRIRVFISDASGTPVSAFTNPISTVSKDDAAFVTCTNQVTYVGNGYGYIDLTAGEMNCDGVVFCFQCTEGSYQVEICPEEAGDIRVNATQCNGTNLTSRDIGASVLLSSGTGTGQLDFTSGVVKSNVTQLNSVANAAARLALSANQIIPGTVDTVTNTHTPTTTVFEADDITEATTSHYNGRIIIFTTGALAGQATAISAYSNIGGIGHFTVVAMTEAPANNDTFVIV